MRRYMILLLSVLVPVFALASCAGTGTTEGDGKVTGKVMLKNSGNGICLQLPIGLMWQIEESNVFDTWEEANEYARNLELGGFNDWRLPTRNECLMLSELLLLKKGDCPIKNRASHWVQDRSRHVAGRWEDYPLCGGPEFRWIKSGSGIVRAVRP